MLRVGPFRDVYRVRLEGRAELLEAARSRLRELLDVLRGHHWEERVRARVALLRAAGPELERADAALTQALRRARVEGWPERSPTVRLLNEVRGLSDAFFRTAAERLGSEGTPSGGFTDWLWALEEHARCVPREVPPERRGTVADEVLPDDLPVLTVVSAFGALLRKLFSEPFDPARPLPFTPEDLDALKKQWSEGKAALALCWERLTRVDPRGGVVGEVRKRAGRDSHHAPHTGPDRLAQAEYWFQTARAALDGIVRERLAPVPPTPTEWTDVVFWLCEKERNPETRLEASAQVSDSRAGLFTLACELWEPSTGAASEARPWPERRWERMVEGARRAEPEARSPGALRVREALRTFSLARSLGTPLMRGWQEHASLEEWVRHARDAAG